MVWLGDEKYYLINAELNAADYNIFGHYNKNKDEEEILNMIVKSGSHLLIWSTPLYSPNKLHTFSDKIQVFWS